MVLLINTAVSRFFSYTWTSSKITYEYVNEFILSEPTKETYLADKNVEDDRGSVVEKCRIGEEKQHEVFVVQLAHTLVEPLQKKYKK